MEVLHPSATEQAPEWQAGSFPFLSFGVLLDLLQPYHLLLDGSMNISEPSCGYERDFLEGLGRVPELSFHLGDVSVGAPMDRLG